MPSRPRILFYAINGTGLGHLSRLTAIARHCRQLLQAMHLEGDLRIVTTSEAPQLASDLPVYKLPSKTIAKQVGIAAEQFQAEGKLFISNLIAGMRPDILVLDTIPEGSYREFTFIKDYARATCFIDRHQDQGHSRQALHQRHLSLYDRILVPDDEAASSRYPIAEADRHKRHFVGRIHGFRPDPQCPRQELRQLLGVSDEQHLVYVSAGGGGDQLAEAQLDQLIEALLPREDLVLLVGYGPLYRGRVRRHERLIAMTDVGGSRYFPALDAAISAAGYNSYEELLAAQVPCSFFAQSKGRDRQDQRIALGAERGWNRVCPSLQAGHIIEEITALLDGNAGDSLRTTLSKRQAAQGACCAAAQILSLHSTLAGSAVKRDSLAIASQASMAATAEQDVATQWPLAMQLLHWSEGPLAVEQLAADCRSNTSSTKVQKQCRNLLLEADSFTTLLDDVIDEAVQQELLRSLLQDGGSVGRSACIQFIEDLLQLDKAAAAQAMNNLVDCCRQADRRALLTRLRQRHNDQLSGVIDDLGILASTGVQRQAADRCLQIIQETTQTKESRI